jgi:hypothetical protein
MVKNKQINKVYKNRKVNLKKRNETKHYYINAHAHTFNAIKCNAMQYNAMQCNAIQCSTMQCNTMQYNVIQ